jgi:hypothetical protein
LVLDDISRPLINSYYYEATFFSLLRAKGETSTRCHQPSVLLFNTLQKVHVFDRLTPNKKLRLQRFRHVAFRENSKSKVVDLNGFQYWISTIQNTLYQALDFQESQPCPCSKDDPRPTLELVRIRQVYPEGIP